MLRIPKQNGDLLRLSRLRDVGRILGFVSFCALWIGSAILYNDSRASVPEMRITGWRMALLALLTVLAGALLFRLPRLITRRTLRGRVTERSFAGTYTASEDPHRRRYDFRTRTSLRLARGQKKSRLHFEQKNGFYVYYSEGAEVIRLRNLPYPLRLEQTKETGFLCVACGELSPERLHTCPKCGHSVIDERELKQ